MSPTAGTGGRRILAVTGGHRVDLPGFLEMIHTVCLEQGWTWAHSQQPVADEWLDADTVDQWDAVVFYDLRGLRLQRGQEPVELPHDGRQAERLSRLTELGTGIVALHHSLASWPSWDGWADIVGGRFHYTPGTLHGHGWPSSGTRFTTYTATVTDPDHPVTAGVEDFTLDDELYCCPVFTDEIHPLLRTSDPMDRSTFVSTRDHVVVGEQHARDCTDHPPASDVIGWSRTAGRSRVVYLQPGEDGATFSLPGYRKLIRNAIDWTAAGRVS